MQTYTFYVNGMHCAACVVLTESELSEVKGITKAKSDLATNTVTITGEFVDRTKESIAEELSKVLKPHGYTLSVKRAIANQQTWGDFALAFPIAMAFVLFFIILQKLGIVNVITTSDVSYGTAFIIGIVASLSTCMAVVGGLVLSMSASFAKTGDKIKPQLLFHGGRLVSFFVLGGVIGALGSVFALGSLGTFILSSIVAGVLLILGINLLDVFPWANKLQLTMPKFIGAKAYSLKDLNHRLTPFLLGIVTFFLPCGFTQSMQIYTLTTGNFFIGALIMFSFALGTLPMLLLLSFSSVGIDKKPYAGVFFKAVGLIIIFFAIFNFMNALAAIGVIEPILSF